ncbi:unnamed protein product [Mycena citricolor]|uniref:Glycosyltransferase family 28 N-terminal domain-containing protein n=1 Tax=Mycena citricolor TaxID=2018698 RepID=A0AAD2HU09_9AGAR|nr:unnamed protein product [Mycena citricolor]
MLMTGRTGTGTMMSKFSAGFQASHGSVTILRSTLEFEITGDRPHMMSSTGRVTRASLLSLHNHNRHELLRLHRLGPSLTSTAHISPDGRIIISLDLKRALPDLPIEIVQNVQEFGVDASQTWRSCPPLSIVIMIVGSRGDVQPYVALGKSLVAEGHRVRIATHGMFQGFVEEQALDQLEFFDIGGDPQELMSYMVKNPGLVPGMASLTNGDIGRKRKMLTQVMEGCWSACHSPSTRTGQAFVADAIISNPPAFAHVHCAEALGIPLLLSFTMPWTPTRAFPHPLVNIKASNAENGLTNYLSYALADILTWQGMGDLVNKFRKYTLGLEALSLRSGPSVVDRLKVPWTYCMSPALVPKPEDWKNHIDVVGFYFLDLATSYTPPDDLAKFVRAGDAPVYIGFGSIVVDDPVALTNIIFEATAQAGVRALVSAGWGGLGGQSIPSHVFILGNVPHDWLFSENRVSAVVHHGGAGTTAIGLAKGRPTVVVPFFGDQAFWSLNNSYEGEMIHKAGAGPDPIPHKQLTAQNLCDALKFAVSPQAGAAAGRMGEQIRHENGVNQGVDSFYRHLPLLNMRCDMDSARVAAWWSTEHCLKFSTFAAQVLIDAKLIKPGDLELHRSKEYDSVKEITNPVTGGASAIFWTVTNYYAGIAQIFYILSEPLQLVAGVIDIVSSIHQGVANVPKLYGSKVRKAGKVGNFADGVKEGGKGLFFGYYDGITGLVREPYEGAQKEVLWRAFKSQYSLTQFIKGLSVLLKALCGALPMRRSGQPAASSAWSPPRHGPVAERAAACDAEAGASDPRNEAGARGRCRAAGTRQQKADVVSAFKELERTKMGRQKRWREMAEKEMYNDGEGQTQRAGPSS